MWNFFNQTIFKLVKTVLKHKLRLLSLREIIWFKLRLFWFHWWLLFFSLPPLVFLEGLIVLARCLLLSTYSSLFPKLCQNKGLCNFSAGDKIIWHILTWLVFSFSEKKKKGNLKYLLLGEFCRQGTPAAGLQWEHWHIETAGLDLEQAYVFKLHKTGCFKTEINLSVLGLPW